ncbi:MAG: hypothetical protein ACU83U_11165 [Gammaproteobacteria bacterium]
MTKITQLENEMNQKINELNKSLHAQNLLHDRLKGSVKTLREVESQLHAIEANLKDSNECNQALMQENWQLRLSCDQWMKRAIKLEFKVLNARDAKS